MSFFRKERINVILQNTVATRIICCITCASMVGFALPLSVYGDQKKKTQDTSKPSVSPNNAVQDLIREVKRNEKLYSDLKLRLTCVYERLPKPADVKKQIHTETDIIIDVQNEKFRQHKIEKGRFHVTSFVPSKERPSYISSGTSETIEISDGDTHRKFWSYDFFRDKNGKPRQIRGDSDSSSTTTHLSNLARPHMFLSERSGSQNFPLSTYFEGIEAINDYLDTLKSYTLETRIIGTEKFQGLECIKIMTKLIGRTGKPIGRREIWLAKDRNLIPVHQLRYKYRWSKEVPVEESTIDEWKEVQPGVWFPMKAHRNHYNSLSKKPTDKRALMWRRQYDVKNITLNPPQRAPDVFTKLNIPKETSVDESKNQKKKSPNKN